MSEPEPSNCKRCGKAVLAGLVEELYPMQLTLREVPYEDARLLRTYGVPVVQIRLRKLGETVRVTSSKMFQDSDEGQDDWVSVLPHQCDVYRLLWGLT